MPDSAHIGRIYVGIDATWNENIPVNESSYFQPLEDLFKVTQPSKVRQISDFEYLVGLNYSIQTTQYYTRQLESASHRASL